MEYCLDIEGSILTAVESVMGLSRTGVFLLPEKIDTSLGTFLLLIVSSKMDLVFLLRNKLLELQRCDSVTTRSNLYYLHTYASKKDILYN
jgi:hypothetical protein